MATQTNASPSGYRDLFTDGRGELSLAIVLLLLVATLDVLIVATAMPTILAQLGDVELYSWVFASYTLASIAALPVASALTGRWGLRRMMPAVLAIFVAGSVVCALAPSMIMLVLGRALQGIGAGGLFAMPYIMISQRFPSTLQPRALAMTSGVWGLSSLSGPLVGALLLELWGWPAIFWINLPLCAVVLLLGLLGLRGTTTGDPNAAPVNLVSPLLLTLATGLLLAAPTAAAHLSWLLGFVGIVAALLFALVERRSAHPIIPLRAWRAEGPLGAAFAALTLASVSFFAAETFLPLLVQSGRGYRAVVAGALISLGSVAWTIGSLWSGRQIYPRPRINVVVGLMLLTLGSLGLLLVVWGLPLALAYLAWIVAGLGMGVLVQASTLVVLDNARGPQATSITASSQLALSLGSSAGTALAGVVAQLGFGPNFRPDRSGGLLSPDQVLMLDRGVAYTLILAIAAALVTLAITPRLPRERQFSDQPPPPTMAH
jgi:MFS family permease